MAFSARYSVQKQPDSPYWYAFFRGADGRRKKKSLGLRADEVGKRKAEEAASILARAAQRARDGKLTEEYARKAVSEMFETAAGRPLLFQSVDSWLRGWLADKTAAKSKATVESYRYTVESFLAHLGERARRSIELVTPRDVQTFRDGHVKAGKSPQTANFYVNLLRIPFNLARRHGLIPSNPAEAVDPLPSKRGVRGTFTIEQIRALLLTAQTEGFEEWRGAILVGFYTGQRLTDIANLRWESIDLPNSVIRLTQRKTGRQVTLPIQVDLLDWLLTRPAPKSEREFVFPSLVGRGTGGSQGLSWRFSALMDKAHIARGSAREGSSGVRNLSALSFHSLRHTFTSFLANGGVAEEIRRELTGHQSEEVHRSYTHHELRRLRDAVEILPTIKTDRL